MAKALCSLDECDSPAVGRSLCSKHYQRARFRGQLDQVAPAPAAKTCENCGEEFAAAFRRWGAIYCSKACNEAARQRRKREATGRRAESCEQCGNSLVGKRAHARFCSGACGQTWRNAQTAMRVLTSKAARRPCRGCGGRVPAERRGNALYCSDACKIASRRHEAYGLTKEELAILLTQHEACAICGTVAWGHKGPQVDHCHATGKVRGILCQSCNNGLGRFKDDPSRLRAAVEYLERR